ncbi:CLUMA_CG012307, isoform A [Clunio marinus]|uniref:CLUMA_CG012307, isoform A n=1 Tax=Clunio marinus TaxID=568069 RepID=A0A1J1IEV4_9DIPT|nr:CLUMA_CG012307, isoform A [Clunio marinus]
MLLEIFVLFYYSSTHFMLSHFPMDFSPFTVQHRFMSSVKSNTIIRGEHYRLKQKCDNSDKFSEGSRFPYFESL